MYNEVELLAPAGSYDAFIAAIQNGADAIYLGGKEFNARQNADNFDNEKLIEVVDYAHVRGVKVYIALNTLLTNRELIKLTDFLIYIHSIGVDGVIVQDLGVAKFIKEVIPELKLHASTQMTIHSLEGVKELEKLGFDRVVLARELSLEEIKYICENTTLEVEVFVHGALCVCYSGQCLMSSLIGGRSGNRGTCAQPCRLQYSLSNKDNKNKLQTNYLLSPKDLCTINNVSEIIKAGVKSLKVEGRMKRPEYVATVIGIYRKYIDRFLNGEDIKVNEKDLQDLMQIFNRGGFTNGYLLGKQGKDMMAYEKPNNWGVYIGKVDDYNFKTKQISIRLENSLVLGDGIEFWGSAQGEGIVVNKILKNNLVVEKAQKDDLIWINSLVKADMGTKVYKTSSIELLNTARQTYKEGINTRKIKIKGWTSIKLGQVMNMAISDIDNNNVKVCGDIVVEEAKTSPLLKERLIEQLNKLGNTPFVFETINVELDNNISLPVSEINGVRRQTVENLANLRINKFRNQIDLNEIKEKTDKLLNKKVVKQKANIKLSIYLTKIIDNYKDIKLDFDRIYIPFTEFFQNKQKFIDFVNYVKNKKIEVYLVMPRITRKNINNLIINNLLEILRLDFDGIITTGIGQLDLLKDYKIKIGADFTYNIFNNQSIELLSQKGISCCTLSPELNLSQVKDIINNSSIESELLVYGRIPVMISEYCPIGSIEGGLCNDKKCSNNCTENEYEIIDRMKEKFPIITDKITCQSQILNSKILFLGEDIKKVINTKPNYIRINITNETISEINDIIDFHKKALNEDEKFINNYKEYIEKFKGISTKGHYFRGVE